MLTDKPAMMLRAVLAAAGIPYETDSGFADFHSLRHTFVSNLTRGGVHPKNAQKLARHSTITLTMDRYSHTVLGDLATELDVLPSTEPVKPDRQVARATGTDDATPDEVAAPGQRAGVSGRPGVSRSGTTDVGTTPMAAGRKSLESQGFDANCPGLLHYVATQATVAQLAEQRFCKPQVPGSSPGGGFTLRYRKGRS